MPNNSRTWVRIALLGLLVIGAAMIAAAVVAPEPRPPLPTPIPTALNIDQSIPYPAVPRVSVENAHSAWQARQAVFVDVRSAGQYASSHIPGAKSIPLNELDSRLNELNKDQAIITYCT